MSKKGNQKSKKDKKEIEALRAELTKPWISMRTGLIVVAIASVGMAVLTAWQAIPTQGTLNGILWGLFYGGLIWVIFFGNLLLNRFLRRKR